MTPDMHHGPTGLRTLVDAGSGAPAADVGNVQDWSVGAAYEREHGLVVAVERGRRRAARVIRAIAAPADVVFGSWTDGAVRRRWLGGSRFDIDTAAPHRLLRLAWTDGSSVDVEFLPRGTDRTTVCVNHLRLRGASEVAWAKAFWEERLARLKVLLEGV